MKMKIASIGERTSSTSSLATEHFKQVRIMHTLLFLSAFLGMALTIAGAAAADAVIVDDEIERMDDTSLSFRHPGLAPPSLLAIRTRCTVEGGKPVSAAAGPKVSARL
jgi:hypothetical protein